MSDSPMAAVLDRFRRGARRLRGGLPTAQRGKQADVNRRPSRATGAARAASDIARGKGSPKGDYAGGRFQGVTPADRRIVEAAKPYTMTSIPRLLALIDAVRYCVARDVPGAFVECGVWRGGSVMAMILTLQELGLEDRDIYLFDTFEGKTKAPSARDTSPYAAPALETWKQAHREGVRPYPELFGPEVYDEGSVRETLEATGYPASRIKTVCGLVEETLPGDAPDELALLRLDTDWYESTRHELLHLYPRLAPGGVLIIDDYGFWDGARDAVDEYFSETADPVLLNRIDFTGRIAVKH